MNAQDRIKIDRYSGSVWILLVGLFSATIYFNEKAQDPFNTPKLIILMVVAGWLSGHLVDHFRKTSIKLLSNEFFVLIITLVFITSLLVSLFFTDVFLVGFIGDTQRRNGFLSYLTLVVIFLFTAVRMNFFYIIRMIKGSIIVGGILSFYGLQQLAGRDFVNWNNPYNAMISTLGNPNFASALLAILTLISIFALLLETINRAYKFLALTVLLMSVIAIYQSNSRQGLLVLTFGLMCYATLYSLFNLRKFKKVILIAISSAVIFITLGMLQIGPLADLLYKESVSVRGYYWRAAIEMFRSHPITGIGLDRYAGFFKEYREIGYPLKYGFDLTSSNAHNVFLQMFCTGGILSGLSYLILLFYIFYIGLKALKITKSSEHKTILLLLSTWVGFQAQSLISIDNIGVSIWGWVLSGSILGAYSNLLKNPIERKDINRARNARLSISIFQPVISGIILVPIIIGSIYLIRAETDTYSVRYFAEANDIKFKEIAYQYSQKVIQNPLADPNYKYQSSLYLSDLGYPDQTYNQIYKLYKKDFRNLDYLGWLSWYENSKKNFAKEIYYRNQISRFDPWNLKNYLLLGQAYKQAGNLEGVIEMKKKIITLAPGTEIAAEAAKELA